jgi:hypothetical protein
MSWAQSGVHLLSIITPRWSASYSIVFLQCIVEGNGLRNITQEVRHHQVWEKANQVGMWPKRKATCGKTQLHKRGNDRRKYQAIFCGHRNGIPKMKGDVSGDDFVGYGTEDKKKENIAAYYRDCNIVDEDIELP